MTSEKTPVNSEKTPVNTEAAAPPAQRGPAPVGTLVVIGVLLLSIIWLWMLVLGILQGQA